MYMIISILESLWFTFANVFNDKKYRNKLINKFWNQIRLRFLNQNGFPEPRNITLRSSKIPRSYLGKHFQSHKSKGVFNEYIIKIRHQITDFSWKGDKMAIFTSNWISRSPTFKFRILEMLLMYPGKHHQVTSAGKKSLKQLNPQNRSITAIFYQIGLLDPWKFLTYFCNKFKVPPSTTLLCLSALERDFRWS